MDRASELGIEACFNHVKNGEWRFRRRQETADPRQVLMRLDDTSFAHTSPDLEALLEAEGNAARLPSWIQRPRRRAADPESLGSSR